ncbi:MAG: LysE family translocator [Calditrichia bacterium]
MIAAWLTLMIPLVFSPGPINIISSISGAQVGFKKSIPFLISINIVYFAYGLITGLGVGQLLAAYPALMMLMQYGGGAFIAWQGITLCRRQRSAGTEQSFGFREGLILQALNPKIIIILITMYSAFLEMDRPLVQQVLLLTAGTIILNILNVTIYTVAGQLLGSRLSSPKMMRRQDQVFRILLIIVGLWIAFR